MIEVVAYNPDWPQQFQDLKAVFDNTLRLFIRTIEHVGSTAVPGLAAKPILDIDIIIENETQLNRVIVELTTLGYEFIGDLGIKDRYAFKPVSDLSPYTVPKVFWPKHNLYCCIVGAPSLNNHLLFRDALRSSTLLVAEYAALKRQLALSTNDIDIYVESKSAFIAKVLSSAGFSIELLEDVISQNRKKSLDTK